MIYCGDLVVSGYLPNLEEGKIDDWNRWLISLDLVLSLKPEYLVPGHGKVLSGENVKKEADRIKLTIKRAIGMI